MLIFISRFEIGGLVLQGKLTSFEEPIGLAEDDISFCLTISSPWLEV